MIVPAPNPAEERYVAAHDAVALGHLFEVADIYRTSVAVLGKVW
jgi:hypothetical protein